MLLEDGTKLVMIGDSVTDCERARPVGEGLFNGIGNSYVSDVQSLLSAFYPEKRIRVINMGVSGDNTRNLLARWKTDVIDLKPDWLSIMIGFNDVWRQFDSPLQTEQHVYIDEYEKNLDELIKQSIYLVKGLVLMTPYYLEPNKNDAMRATMDKYGLIVKKLAQKYNVLLVDTQAAFDEFLKYYHPNYLTWDRIHPNNVGRMIIAKEFLKKIGFEWK